MNNINPLMNPFFDSVVNKENNTQLYGTSATHRSTSNPQHLQYN